ncbi:MAG: ankyrin repeat domain-containing protein [Pseudomonadota bacterium]
MKKEIPESAFPDPIVREAAQALADGSNTQAIKQAADAGLIDYVTPDGETLLTLAVLMNDPKAVKLLLEHSANPEVPADKTPLALAARGGADTIVDLLLASGASPDSQIGGQPAVVAAARVGHTKIVQALVRSGANLERSDIAGSTALIAAARLQHYELASGLLSVGASPFAHDTRGRTAANWALEDDLIPSSPTAKKRDALLEAMRAKGYPWPAPSGEEILAAKAEGKWPPR